MWGFFTSDPTKNFPFEIGEKVKTLESKSLWSLHIGKRKANGEAVSIFSFEIKGASDTLVELATACFKRVKTLRHPHMLTYLDGLETDKVLYFVTEPVVPLLTYLQDKERDRQQNELSISWGLYTVSKALSFMVNDCGLVHNNVNIWSVFVNRAGDWLLGGVDFSFKTDGKSTLPIIKPLPDLEKYAPPEKQQSVVRGARWAVDSWGLGCLVWETFNGSLPRSSSLKAIGKIPQLLVSSYCELVGANPKSRPNPAKFIENCRISGGFMNNTFIDTMLFLDEIQIKDQSEKTSFFQKLTPSLDSFPSHVCRHKLLPQLIIAFEYSNSGSAILAPLLKVGKTLETGQYQKMIIPCVIKLFTSPDRNTRVKLLQQVETFVEHLQPSTVNDQIFPHIVQGFSDSNPVVRESTIKAMTHLASKLNYKNINEILMQHFARLQTKDDQGGIRTNTTICLGKIASFIDPKLRQKLLLSAFTRATRDPFPPARQAGILAMAATQHFYYLKEIALKLLPALCTLTLDSDKGVRCQAFKAMHGFVEKLEKVSEDPSCLEEMEKYVLSGSSAGEGVSGWAGWAVSGMSSLTSRLYKSKHPPAKGSPAKEDANKPVDTSESTASRAPRAETNRAPTTTTTEAQESGDRWGDGWGDMDDLNVSDDMVLTSEMRDANSRRNDEDEVEDGDNWGDEEDWGSLETFGDQVHTDPTPSFQETLSTASSYFSDTQHSADFFSQAISQDDKSSKKPPQKPSQATKAPQQLAPAQKPTARGLGTSSMADTGWEDSGWGDGSEWGTSEPDLVDNETRKRQEREDKRKQRQQDLQSKREDRKAGGMKLGAKKVAT